MIRKILLPLGAKLKALIGSRKRLLGATAIFAALAGGLFFPSSAEAWWGPWWGWHAGWGWRPGVVIGVPPVAVVPPVYPAPGYRWVPGHYTPYGYYVPGHWVY